MTTAPSGCGERCCELASSWRKLRGGSSLLVTRGHPPRSTTNSLTSRSAASRRDRDRLTVVASDLLLQAMLLQLRQLRRALCRAAYALDAFRWQVVDDTNRRRRSLATTVSRSRSRLEAALRDVRELVVLLGGCPRVTSKGQPYSVYLLMERCMFGRQMEKEQIIGFCLSRPPSDRDLDVLPIIGPHEVGKRTLVEHVCLDDRVRERFPKIHRLRSDQLFDHEHDHWSPTARSLMVIDMVDGDVVAEDSWLRFHSAVRRRTHQGSKIIVISRTEAHSSMLGTVPPLRLLPPRPEELWYFFRALAFGAADPDDHSPELTRIAMALCDGITDLATYAAANMVAASLRADLSARSWRRFQKVYAEATPLQLGEGFYYLYRPVKDAPGDPPNYLFSNRRKLVGLTRSELAVVTKMDLLAGSSLPPAGETRFDVLVWQSRLPPFGSYVATCDMEGARQVVAAGEKRIRQRHTRL